MGLRSTTALHVQQSWKRLTVLLSLARLAQALLEDLRVLCVHGEVVLRCSSRRGMWRWFRSFFVEYSRLRLHVCSGKNGRGSPRCRSPQGTGVLLERT